MRVLDEQSSDVLWTVTMCAHFASTSIATLLMHAIALDASFASANHSQAEGSELHATLQLRALRALPHVALLPQCLSGLCWHLEVKRLLGMAYLTTGKRHQRQCSQRWIFFYQYPVRIASRLVTHSRGFSIASYRNPETASRQSSGTQKAHSDPS